jgi:DNA gyrase subunit B
MPEIIERGHLYIAQPPLFKVTEGKGEKYVKDEETLNQYLVSRAVAKSEVIVQQGNKKLTDRRLAQTLEKISLYHNLIQRLQNKGYPRSVLSLLLENGIREKAAFAEKEKAAEFQKKLQKGGFEVLERFWDEEHNLFGFEVQKSNGGGEPRVTLQWDLIASVEYRQLHQMYREIKEMTPPPYILKGKEKELTVEQEEELLQLLNQVGKEGLSIQRYKGLGEMNPGQLWQTTMNPETRTLLKVRVEDAVEADEIFSVLMGDEVETRRQFIEENALFVKNLDI